MKWLWNNVLAPVFKAAVGFLTAAFRWALEHPVAGIVIGTVALVGCLWIDSEETQAIVAAWGITMIVCGVLGWAYGGVKPYVDALAVSIAPEAVSTPASTSWWDSVNLGTDLLYSVGW